MFIKFKAKLKNANEIIALGLLVFITIIFTSYYNFTKNNIFNNYKNIINNIYFKKTSSYFLNNLEPRFKKINHNVQNGETFDNILNQYLIKKKEISEIKKQLSKKINLNKLNTNQRISFTLDQSNNIIKEFEFKISNTEKVLLVKDFEKDKFNQEIILTSLKKDIVYSENIILESLYKAAINKKVPANIIVGFAQIYGFR